MLFQPRTTYSITKILKQSFKVLKCSRMCNTLQVPSSGKSDLFTTEYSENNALNPTTEDMSHIVPYFPESFNIAAYVNKSETLQSLLKLGVDLSKIEKKPIHLERFLTLDFERDMKGHIFFLNDYVAESQIGEFITKNPMIFLQSLDDLQVRVNYLQYKKFKKEQIERILSTNPFWLMFSTVRIDKRLGLFQNKFQLEGNEVRELTVKQPRLITYNLHNINTNSFAIREEMGFNDNEIKHLILKKPKLLMMNQLSLIRRFNYIHETMKVSHEQIITFPEVLLCRLYKLQQRHSFLQSLGRAQYDPKKENYVSLKALVEGCDVDFCQNIAKCNVIDYNLYLKTL